METTHKIALITGGSRGLGKSMALKLAESGHHIILTYRSKADEANEVVNTIEKMGRSSAALPLDVGEMDQLGEFIQSLQKVLSTYFEADHLSFLINNAGIGASIPYEQVDESTFDQFMNIHLKGVYFLTQRLLPMIQDGGRIINVSSGTTRYFIPGYSIYATMKGAVETFTKYLAQEIGTRKITANVIAPGAIETDFNQGMVRDNPKVKEMLVARTALGRIGQPNDIGNVVDFLCSPASDWITGQRIELSGGMNL